MTLLERMRVEFPSISPHDSFGYIMCGEVLVNGEKVVNPKLHVKNDAVIEFTPKKFVSRGGLKLQEALSRWNIKCKGKVFLDAGSSTGGFTDALLQRGASGVHSVDVGYNQLAYSLRINPLVYVHEKTNIMEIEKLDPAADAGVADLSFRSITGAASKILELVKEKWLIALVKPQFEVSAKGRKDFNGVITDKSLLFDTVIETSRSILKEGLSISDVILSPVTGKKGNTEFFFYINSGGRETPKDIEKTIRELVFSS